MFLWSVRVPQLFSLNVLFGEKSPAAHDKFSFVVTLVGFLYIWPHLGGGKQTAIVGERQDEMDSSRLYKEITRPAA